MKKEQGVMLNAKREGDKLKVYSVMFVEKSKEYVEQWLAENAKEELFDIRPLKNGWKAIHYFYETDKQGKHKVIEQSNGVKIRLLIEPSEDYKAKAAEEQEAEALRLEAAMEAEEKERLIKNKMRELAIKELKDEGKL